MGNLNCHKCGKGYDPSDVEMYASTKEVQLTVLNMDNPGMRKLLGMKTLTMQSIASVEDIGYVFSCHDLEEEDIMNRSYIPGGNVELHLKKCEIRAIRAATGEVLASQTVTADIPMSFSVEYHTQNGVVLNPEAGKTYTAQVDSEQYTSAYMALCEEIGIPWES